MQRTKRPRSSSEKGKSPKRFKTEVKKETKRQGTKRKLERENDDGPMTKTARIGRAYDLTTVAGVTFSTVEVLVPSFMESVDTKVSKAKETATSQVLTMIEACAAERPELLAQIVAAVQHVCKDLSVLKVSDKTPQATYFGTKEKVFAGPECIGQVAVITDQLATFEDRRGFMVSLPLNCFALSKCVPRGGDVSYIS
jgi:hypothetical protein